MRYDPSRRLNASVIGCGIAGPVVAIALQQAGFAVTIHEAHPEPRESAGAFLTVAPNGLNALGQLGIEADVIRLGHPCLGMDFLNESGKLLASIDSADERLRFGKQTTLIRRADLARSLRRATEAAGVTVRLGRKVSDLQQLDDGILLHFANGEVAKADMAIGCDGVFSRSRRVAFPEFPSPVYTGQTSAGGYVSNSSVEGETNRMRMHFGKRGFFGYYLCPNQDAYWFSNLSIPSEAEAIALGVSEHSSSLRDRIWKFYKDDVAPLPKLIEETQGDIGCWPIYEVSELPTWSRESLCLIGDAAHAMPPHGGQGASAAMEDAIALANAILVHQDPAFAFAAFEAKRRERVARLHAVARRNGTTKTLSRWARWVRDLLLPIFIKRQSTDWIHAYQEQLILRNTQTEIGV